MTSLGFNADKYLELWTNGWKKNDITPLMEDVADDVEFVDPFSEAPGRGKAAYRENFDGYLRAFRLERLEARAVVQSGDVVAYYLRAHVVHNGDLPLPDGSAARATGRKVTLDFADFIWTRGGRIVRDEVVFDTAALLRQVGGK